jgi:hypothetical protein
MLRRLLKFAVLGSIAVVGLIVGTIAGCNAVYPDATTRLMRTFGIERADLQHDPNFAASLEAAIAKKLPLGTSEADIRAYLAARGVGRDGVSSVHDLNPGRGIACRIDRDTRSFEIVHTTHFVTFTLDAEGRLANIETKSWYTGP